MFIGKIPTSTLFTERISLHTYANMSLPDQVMKILDPRILLEEEE